MNRLFHGLVFARIEEQGREPVIVECWGKCKAKDFKKVV